MPHFASTSVTDPNTYLAEPRSSKAPFKLHSLRPERGFCAMPGLRLRYAFFVDPARSVPLYCPAANSPSAAVCHAAHLFIHSVLPSLLFLPVSCAIFADAGAEVDARLFSVHRFCLSRHSNYGTALTQITTRRIPLLTGRMMQITFMPGTPTHCQTRAIRRSQKAPISQENNVDVLIIGAGPAGLFCANGLARAGISVRIVDKNPEKVAVGHADGFQPRTLEVLQSYGLAERVFREGAQIHTAAFYHPSPNGGIERANTVADVTGTSARYPFEVTMHQGKTESIFLDSLEGMGVSLKHLRDEVPSEIVRAKFVVGADGAHSWVRNTLGIAMEGENSDNLWGVPCGILQWIMRPVALEVGGRLDKSKLTPEEILRIGQDILRPYKMDTQVFHWWTAFLIGQRLAAKYSVHERVFIAGDACHTHSPTAGQGMNASMNDSHNLVWKMVHVLRGWADMSLLRTYEDERRRYAQDLIALDKEYAALSTKKPKTDDREDRITHEEGLRVYQSFGDFTSGIGILYAPSTIVNSAHQSVATGLTIGKRMLPQVFLCAADGRPYEIHDLLPADTRFKLLIFAGDTNQEAQMRRVCGFAEALSQKDSFFNRYGRHDPSVVFDVLVISSASVNTADHSSLEKAFGLHWSKVFVDDRAMYGHTGGNGYETCGVDRGVGAVVVVRPDGYVGMAAPLQGTSELDAYFSKFMMP
ncbi:hypothetical protein NM688_g42 [Phlebia brevispora]|uniref:Uncharacterized protein n=1 Tax=Phlebia brevispora TaxID=194682 RepID=A0ACC1TFQ1_9APHY|nr:hypothetical protein NM688_g42 [Phlebia brevispora]